MTGTQETKKGHEKTLKGFLVAYTCCHQCRPVNLCAPAGHATDDTGQDHRDPRLSDQDQARKKGRAANQYNVDSGCPEPISVVSQQESAREAAAISVNRGTAKQIVDCMTSGLPWSSTFCGEVFTNCSTCEVDCFRCCLAVSAWFPLDVAGAAVCQVHVNEQCWYGGWQLHPAYLPNRAVFWTLYYREEKQT